MRILSILAMLWLLNPVSLAFSQAYRCGSSYQQIPCDGGSEIQLRSDRAGEQNSERAVYLCKKYSGQRFWTRKPCDQYPKATLERTELVPSNASWKEQVSRASKRRSEAEAFTKSKPLQTSARVRRLREPNCTRIKKALDRNASAARIGGSARRMDQLNDQRRRLFTESARARC